MIIVTVKTDGEKVMLKSEGHAYFSENGTDIVCAAVSALVFTALTFLDNGRNEIDISELDSTDGLLMIVFYTRDKRMRAAVEFFETGIGLIAERYPDHVKLITKHREIYQNSLSS